jgi:hypothetical protein
VLYIVDVLAGPCAVEVIVTVPAWAGEQLACEMDVIVTVGGPELGTTGAISEQLADVV